MTDLYPFESRFQNVGGLRLHYVDEGSGDPIVMVHGNPTWSFYFRNLVLALRTDFRAIAVDHIGCGLSEKPVDDRYNYTLDQRVDDLETLLGELGVTENITLVLHDWGGMIGMAYASRHPQLIKRLVLLNTGAFRLPKDKPLPWQLKLCRIPLIGAVLVRGFNLFCRGTVGLTCQPLPLDVRNAYLAPYDSWANRIAVHRFVQDIPLTPGDPAYQAVLDVEQTLGQFRQVPTLICWGARDFVFDDHFLNQWRAFLPQAEVHRFPNAGHLILEDEPEAVVSLVRGFLTRHPLPVESVSTR